MPQLRRFPKPKPRCLGFLLALVLLAAPFQSAYAENADSRQGPPGSITSIELYPERLTLDGPRDARRVLVFGLRSDRSKVDLTSSATYKPKGDGVEIDSLGFFKGKANGQNEVLVSAAGQSATLSVDVRNSDEAKPVSFVRDVMPVISRVGCNAGTCHGAADGKNGFKLSLRGYDPRFDYIQLVDDLAGRRFNRSDPEQSLMLLKPINAVPHEGGYVLDPESDHFAILRAWIAEGVSSDVGQVARVESLDVYPPSIDLELEGARQQMLVLARYPDGSTRDVTRDAVFESSVPEVATVNDQGLIEGVRRGEAAVLVRYEGSYGVGNVVVMGDRSGFAWQPLEEYNSIDTLVNKKLERVKTLPSDLCTDSEFLRRVHLDLTGLPPTPEAVRKFLADPAESRVKRERVIDDLIGSPAFVTFWAHKWADLLQVNRKLLGDKPTWAYRRWIERAVASNLPYDEMVRRLLTAQGSALEDPAVNYFRASKEPDVALENATHLFLGIRFNCNKCHDHPFERWTQDQYYSLAAFWGQVGTKGGMRAGDQVVYDKPDGEVQHPKDDRVMSPSFPYEIDGEVRSEGSRREILADWLTSSENPYFARSAANRVWSYFLGIGIIDPVDDIRQSNPPSNPELLDYLTVEFLASGFDLQSLMRLICQSRTYQSSFRTNEWNEDDMVNFSHARPRRLTAEQLQDAIDIATGRTPQFPGVPAGFRAAELPDSQVASGGFLDLFGRPARETPCECERSSEVSLAQALNLVNGSTIADALIDPEGRIAKLLSKSPEPVEIVEELYLAALCRLPDEDESANGLAYLAESEDQAEAAQDLLWALINSPAFLFNR